MPAADEPLDREVDQARHRVAAAPDPWVEVSPGDARALGISEGDLVEVSSPRGSIQAPARISDIRDGVVFVPFHYGYSDTQDGRAGTIEVGKRHKQTTTSFT